MRRRYARRSPRAAEPVSARWNCTCRGCVSMPCTTAMPRRCSPTEATPTWRAIRAGARKASRRLRPSSNGNATSSPMPTEAGGHSRCVGATVAPWSATLACMSSTTPRSSSASRWRPHGRVRGSPARPCEPCWRWPSRAWACIARSLRSIRAMSPACACSSASACARRRIFAKSLRWGDGWADDAIYAMLAREWASHRAASYDRG